MLKLILLLFILFFKNISAGVKSNCEISSYCGNENYSCSVYGNCNYRLFEYYKVNSSSEDKLAHCQCFQGYSSYDITNLKKNNQVLCCYQQKGMLTAFFLELFVGFGAGHFYLGNYVFACVKLAIQIFLCTSIGCTFYFACTMEHSFESSGNEINNNENINKNIIKENNEIKNIENKNQNNQMIDENENNDIGNYNETNENKNNDSKNQSFELEENRESEIMFKNFISCPKSIFIISLSFISFFIFQIVDICLIAFGIFKDGSGEELYMWN